MIKVIEKCNLKTGVNQWIIDDIIVYTKELSTKEIIEKFKD
jgi:hypothetical protein